jgi:acetolactate synthase-1/2/3 large subunit
VNLPPHLPEAGELWDRADLVIVVGSDLDGINTQNFKQPQPDRIIALNSTPITNYEIEQYADSLSLKAGNRRPWTDTNALRATALARLRNEHPTEMAFLDSFAHALPDNAVVSADMCIPGYWIAGFHTPSAPRRVQIPLGWGTLGYGFPASIGAALAGVGSAVSVSGDGGFLYACGELATVAQEEVPLTAVVVDDGGYGMLRYDQDVSGEPRYGVDLHTPDHVGLAESFGVRAEAVDDLDEAFGEALAAHVADPRPSLLVARTSEPLVPPPNTSPNWYRR